MRRILAVWVLTLVASGALPLAVGQETPSGAAPTVGFSVEFWGFRFTEPEITLTALPPDRVAFRVSSALTRANKVAGIRTTINGEPAAIACPISRATDGYVVTCDLRRNPQFALRPGRNELRVAADSAEAHYVVFLATPPSATAAPPWTAVETRHARDTADSTPPTLQVPWPAPAGVGTIDGQASDDIGITAVAIDGRPATLRRPSREARANAGAVAFSQEVAPGNGASQVAVEARDQAGNLTRMLLRAAAPRAALSRAFTGRRAALLVGVSEYRHPTDGLGNLLFAASDAQAVRDALVDPKLGAFSPADVELLTNQQATVPAVRDALARLAGRLTSEDVLIVYVNAHGSPDPFVKTGQAPFYFLLHDTRLSDLPRTGYPMAAIDEIIASTRFAAGRKVIFVDACHSGAVTGPQGSEPASRGLERAARSLASRDGVAVMTSSAANEVSYEQKRGALGRGAFTSALLEGLRGGADANRDGTITTGELFASVSACVQQLTGGRQHPQTLSIANADLPLVSLTASLDTGRPSSCLP